MSDERTRWNDQAVDGLARELGDLENQVEALRQLPERMAEVKAACVETRRVVSLLREDQVRGDQREDRRFTQLRQHVDERFDSVDTATAKASSWGTALTFAATVIVPILIALIGGYFALRSGLPAK